jgi:hypothetical protein
MFSAELIICNINPAKKTFTREGKIVSIVVVP